MRYDDPVNREILEAIEAGRAPLSIMNVEPGQPADVSVYKRMDEDYVAPKKKFVPFAGQGNRLGSIVPGTSLEEAIAPQPAAPAAAPAAAAASQAPTVTVDVASPTTNIQIRLGDGTRLVSRFNHTHTVRDVYDFVNASSPASRSRAYVLQTTFPIKELKKMELTLKEAGLVNAVVVQKWS
jgi:UBX domain-containing protein 1